MDAFVLFGYNGGKTGKGLFLQLSLARLRNKFSNMLLAITIIGCQMTVSILDPSLLRRAIKGALVLLTFDIFAFPDGVPLLFCCMPVAAFVLHQ